MTRPCFLVIDREHAGSISTRKLVIETAKLNVITAYSGREAIAMLERFPGVDGVVLDASVRDVPCGELLSRFKQISADIPIVLIGTPGRHDCERADHHLESFEPAKLLQLLNRLVPAALSVQAGEGDLARAEDEEQLEKAGVGSR